MYCVKWPDDVHSDLTNGARKENNCVADFKWVNRSHIREFQEFTRNRSPPLALKSLQ